MGFNDCLIEIWSWEIHGTSLLFQCQCWQRFLDTWNISQWSISIIHSRVGTCKYSVIRGWEFSKECTYPGNHPQIMQKPSHQYHEIPSVQSFIYAMISMFCIPSDTSTWQLMHHQAIRGMSQGWVLYPQQSCRGCDAPHFWYSQWNNLPLESSNNI